MASTTITDWKSDYGAGDTNTPVNATPIPNPPVDDNNALSERIRDIKTVISQEARNKGWEPDALAATRVSSSSFTLAASPAANYPTGTAVKLDLGSGTTAVVYVTNISGVTVTVAPSSVAVGLVSARFSAIKPKSTPYRALVGYSKDVGSPLPKRISQRGLFRLSDTTSTATVHLFLFEIDDEYQVLIQAMSKVGTPIAGAYRFLEIVPDLSTFDVTVDGAPGAGNSVLYEYLIVRGQ